MLNIKSYLKFLSRNRLYTAINFIGLSISLAFVILIANYVTQELTVDNFHKNRDNIYVLGHEKWQMTAYNIGKHLKTKYTHIEETCALYSTVINLKIEDKKADAKFILVDSTFFDMFSFNLISGNRETLLDDKNNIVISESYAKNIYGDSNPIGQTINANFNIYRVVGIFEDFKNTMLPDTDAIVLIDNVTYVNGGVLHELMNAGGVTMFLKIADDTNIDLMEKDILSYFKTFFWIYEKDIAKEVYLTPMKEFYLSELSGGIHLRNNSKAFIYILIIVGGVILICSIFNYINLTIAQSGFRAKEASIRMLLGASKGSIFVKMIFESILFCLIAFMIGLFLALLFEPYLNDLLYANISIISNLSIIWGSVYTALVLGLGVISGLFPAITITRFKPIDVIKGEFAFKSKMTYSKIFITIQAVVTFVLIACSMVIVNQVDHLINRDLGFNSKGIISVFLNGSAFDDNEQFDEFLERASLLDCVKRVGFTKGTPFSMNNLTINKDISYHEIICDSTTFAILGYKIIQDNNIVGDGVWINKSGLKSIGADMSLKSLVDYGKDIRIKGVIDDFLFVRGGGLEFQDGLLTLEVREVKYPWSILIEVKGDEKEAYNEVEKVFKEVTKSNQFNGMYFDDLIPRLYSENMRMSYIMQIFTIITIIIAVLGLLAISAYFVQQRSKEIAVRKVFGSTNREILSSLVLRFMKLIAIATLIAIPIVWVVMQKWLEQFSYRIDLSIWIFILTGILLFGMSAIVVYWHCRIAAYENPVNSIKK